MLIYGWTFSVGMLSNKINTRKCSATRQFLSQICALHFILGNRVQVRLLFDHVVLLFIALVQNQTVFQLAVIVFTS